MKSVDFFKVVIDSLGGGSIVGLVVITLILGAVFLLLRDLFVVAPDKRVRYEVQYQSKSGTVTLIFVFTTFLVISAVIILAALFISIPGNVLLDALLGKF
jgi:hypothetical protein